MFVSSFPFIYMTVPLERSPLYRLSEQNSVHHIFRTSKHNFYSFHLETRTSGCLIILGHLLVA